jgi:hypothetical protein
VIISPPLTSREKGHSPLRVAPPNEMSSSVQKFFLKTFMGSMSDMISVLHQSVSINSKGGDCTMETRQGEQPQEENDPFPLMSKGER